MNSSPGAYSPREFQVEIADWAQRNFGSTPLPVSTLGLAEEAGEVCRAVLKDAQGIRGTHEEWMAELEKELGDVLIKAFEVAYRADIDLWLAFMRRWAVVSQRDFVANPAGHGMPQ